jgi:integrase
MLTFARILGIDPRPVPSHTTIEIYILLHCANFSFSSLSCMLSAIAKHYNTSTIALSTPRIHRLKKGLQRHTTKGKPTKQAFPATFNVVMRLIACLSPSHLSNITLMCVLTIMYSGMLRFSEMYNLKKHNISISSDHHSHPTTFITIPYSKCDLRPCTIQISQTAATFLNLYLLANKHIRHNDYLIPRNLTLQRYNTILKTWAQKAGFTKYKLFSSHSTRAGHATDLFSSNKSQLYIQIKGRWSSDSFLRYIRPLFIHPHNSSSLTDSSVFTRALTNENLDTSNSQATYKARL